MEGWNRNHVEFDWWQLKFIYSEKATKILRNLHLFLTGSRTSQKKVEILQNFCGLLRIYELYKNCPLWFDKDKSHADLNVKTFSKSDIFLICTKIVEKCFKWLHYELRTPGEEIAFTAWPKINSHSQILGTAEAYFVCHIGPNFQISLTYAFIWCP